MNETDPPATEDKRLCEACVADPGLKSIIEAEGSDGVCDYCGQDGKTLAIEDVAGRVEEIFERHFVRTSTAPDAFQAAMLADKDGDYEWERSGEPVVQIIAEVLRSEEEPAEDIRSVLADRHGSWDDMDESEFDDDSHYREQRIDDSEWQTAWARFETELKTESRLLTKGGLARLEAVFGGVEDLRTWRNGALVVAAGPGTDYPSLVRARVFQSDDKLEEALLRPDLHLAAPPSRLATPGRMNFQHIAAFYGATDADTALVEVRPPVGSNVAEVQFNILKPLRLLDLTAVTSAAAHGSYFDPGYAEFSRRMKFLRRLAERMTLPVMPDDVVSEYLPTQTIANYLEHILEPPLDGIVYPSTQVENATGLNVVLFRKAARVKSLAPPDGVRLTLRTGDWYDDEWEQAYTVVERPGPGSPSPDDDDDDWRPGLPTPEDNRPVVLSVDLPSLKVRKVNWLKIEAPGTLVRRSRLV